MLAATPRGHTLKRVHPSKGRLCSKPADIRARLTLPTERGSEGAVADGSGSALSPPRWVRQPRGSAVLTEYEYTPRETLRSAAPHPRGGARAVGLTACGPIPRCTRVLTTQAPRPIKVTTLSKDPSIHQALREKSPRVPTHAVLGSVRAGFQKTRVRERDSLAPRARERLSSRA